MKFFKKKENDVIWWGGEEGEDGKIYFSFDKKKKFNIWQDYPKSLTKEQKEIFDKENPFWADFFKDRK